MTTIYDKAGNVIVVGARVAAEEDWPGGVVTGISDPDGDVNDYGRPVAIPPYVSVSYDDGTEDRHPASWNATGPWDDDCDDFTCEDVVVEANTG